MRLLIEASVHDQVIEQLVAGAKKITPGDPLEKSTRLGALVSRKQQESVLSYIKKGVDEGATLVAGGKAVKPNGKGYYVEATVFDDVTPVLDGEIPVAPVDVEEAHVVVAVARGKAPRPASRFAGIKDLNPEIRLDFFQALANFSLYLRINPHG